MFTIHWMSTAPFYIIVDKSFHRRDGHASFWSTPNNVNDSSYQCEYMDIIYSKIDSICSTHPRRWRNLRNDEVKIHLTPILLFTTYIELGTKLFTYHVYLAEGGTHAKPRIVPRI